MNYKGQDPFCEYDWFSERSTYEKIRTEINKIHPIFWQDIKFDREGLAGLYYSLLRIIYKLDIVIKDDTFRNLWIALYDILKQSPEYRTTRENEFMRQAQQTRIIQGQLFYSYNNKCYMFDFDIDTTMHKFNIGEEIKL